MRTSISNRRLRHIEPYQDRLGRLYDYFDDNDAKYYKTWTNNINNPFEDIKKSIVKLLKDAMFIFLKVIQQKKNTA